MSWHTNVKQAQANTKTCHYCGDEMSSAHWGLPDSATKEHIVPKSIGGAGHLTNIVIVCKKCNEKRGDGPSPCGCRKCTLAWYHFLMSQSIVYVPNPMDFRFRPNKNAYDTLYHRRKKVSV